jgi:branched-chain amino acid transport system substrate-binding protein
MHRKAVTLRLPQRPFGYNLGGYCTPKNPTRHDGFVQELTPIPEKPPAGCKREVVAKYQERAKTQKLDPLGFYLPPWAYAYLQTLEQAVNATKSFDDAKLSDWLHKNTVKTIVGDIKLAAVGEWTESRFLQVQ